MGTQSILPAVIEIQPTLPGLPKKEKDVLGGSESDEKCVSEKVKNPITISMAIPLRPDILGSGKQRRKNKFKPRPDAKSDRDEKEKRLQRDKREELVRRHRTQQMSCTATRDHDFVENIDDDNDTTCVLRMIHESL